ncbi:hypothetical protein HDU97_006935 [Phlyctochytrium planicorne]|nr:hypothetical protein HDU97_006935 [Phlyctochytrium planicorne]
MPIQLAPYASVQEEWRAASADVDESDEIDSTSPVHPTFIKALSASPSPTRTSFPRESDPLEFRARPSTLPNLNHFDSSRATAKGSANAQSADGILAAFFGRMAQPSLKGTLAVNTFQATNNSTAGQKQQEKPLLSILTAKTPANSPASAQLPSTPTSASKSKVHWKAEQAKQQNGAPTTNKYTSESENIEVDWTWTQLCSASVPVIPTIVPRSVSNQNASSNSSAPVAIKTSQDSLSSARKNSKPNKPVVQETWPGSSTTSTPTRVTPLSFLPIPSSLQKPDWKEGRGTFVISNENDNEEAEKVDWTSVLIPVSVFCACITIAVWWLLAGEEARSKVLK